MKKIEMIAGKGEKGEEGNVRLEFFFFLVSGIGIGIGIVSDEWRLESGDWRHN